ncbi:hypothetical protein DL93DRAFT_2070079 [Clavulina sp. PMI_390]|nr:hypothetical protein DL93DRAFT_2070079 [Clavulina sp. PMI_390]
MHTLGRFFTFQLSIRPHHKLIRTGPYHFVRHPSYTGIYLQVIGFLIILQTSDAAAFVLRSSPQVLLRHGSVIVVALVATFLFVHRNFLRERMIVEEKMLAQAFGKEWDQYVADVPYRLIPYVW